MFLYPSLLYRSQIFLLSNYLPSSDKIEWEMPNRHTMFFLRNLIVLALVILADGSVSTRFMKWSIATMVKLALHLPFGKGHIKSTSHFANG